MTRLPEGFTGTGADGDVRRAWRRHPRDLADTVYGRPAAPSPVKDAATLQAMTARADLDAAWLRLTCSVPQHTLNPLVRPEVDRRAVLMGDQMAAVESVWQDIVHRRWTL